MLTSTVYSLSGRNHWKTKTDIYSWRGEFSREGASINEQPYANGIVAFAVQPDAI
jgi:hypothetical protein